MFEVRQDGLKLFYDITLGIVSFVHHLLQSIKRTFNLVDRWFFGILNKPQAFKARQVDNIFLGIEFFVEFFS